MHIKQKIACTESKIMKGILPCQPTVSGLQPGVTKMKGLYTHVLVPIYEMCSVLKNIIEHYSVNLSFFS